MSERCPRYKRKDYATTGNKTGTRFCEDHARHEGVLNQTFSFALLTEHVLQNFTAWNKLREERKRAKEAGKDKEET